MIGTGAHVDTVVFLDNTTSDCTIKLPKVDMTNIKHLVVNQGTGNRIHISGPDTLLIDTGADSYVWCEETEFTPTASAVSGLLGRASTTMKYRRSGKRIDFTANITVTSVSTGAGGLKVTLPYIANGQFICIGANQSTGLGLQGRISNAAFVVIFTMANSFPVADGEIVTLCGSYEAL